MTSRSGGNRSELSHDSKSFGNRWQVALAALGFALLFAGLAQADPLVIRPGYNFLATTPGSYTTLDIPRGFFGAKNGVPSDAIVQRVVNIEGRPMGKLGLAPSSNIAPEEGNCHSEGGHYHCHKATEEGASTDTITQVGGATLKEIGEEATVPLKFIALSLQTPSNSPVRVTFGGANPSFYKLILTLDPTQPQTEGSIVMTRTSARGGSMVVTLPVNFQVTFASGPSSRPLGPVKIKTVLRSSDNIFSVPLKDRPEAHPRQQGK